MVPRAQDQVSKGRSDFSGYVILVFYPLKMPKMHTKRFPKLNLLGMILIFTNGMILILQIDSNMYRHKARPKGVQLNYCFTQGRKKDEIQNQSVQMFAVFCPNEGKLGGSVCSSSQSYNCKK